MRIAQVSPLYESVPPKAYGGTERIVHYITEALVDAGEDVTLFASGDSETSADLIPCCKRSLRLDPTCRDLLVPHFLMLEKVLQRADEFDVIHFHCDYLHYPLSRRQDFAHVTTLHGRLDLPELAPLYREFRDMPLVSISNAQRRPVPKARWMSTVYHGLPTDLYSLDSKPGDYLAFLGRISPEKRADRAVEIAMRTGIPLRVAAKVDRADQEYYDAEIKPLFQKAGKLVEFIGEIGESEKQEFLGRARALLFPIDWPEPFGLVMIEAMACGTPVIAFPCGSVPEVLENGVTGFVVSDIDQAVAAVDRLDTLDRAGCRREFEKRYSAPRMAKNYLEVYRRLIEPQEAADDMASETRTIPIRGATIAIAQATQVSTATSDLPPTDQALAGM
jgi:glycosyltransferase involved in cell wall biosynthesis